MNKPTNGSVKKKIEVTKQGISVAGLLTAIWGAGFEAGVNYTPKYAQRGVTPAVIRLQSMKYAKYSKYFTRAGNILTGADIALSFVEYGFTVNKGWGAKTKLAVNVGIGGLGLIKHPATQGVSIGLGIIESAGAFDGLYNYADQSQKTGVFFVPRPFLFGVQSTPWLIKH